MTHGSDPFPGTHVSHIIEKNGVKLGFYGLVGTDFVGTLNFDVSEFKVADAVECARTMEKKLKEECDYVICLSHCRMPDDVLVATQDTGVSLILGGHDHGVVAEAPIYKAGSDWENVVVAQLIDKKWKCEVVGVPSNYAQDESVLEVLAEWESQLKRGMSKVLATIDRPLDVRTQLIRKAESPVGNWICDLIKHQFCVILGRPVDAVIINAGSFRGDNVIESDRFTVKELLTLLPFNDLTLGYHIKGPKLIEAIEAGVSKWPHENGGFPTVCSGMEIVVKGGKVTSFLINGEQLVGGDPEKKYVLVTKSFLAEGKDGYDCLAGHCELLMDEECAILLSSLVRMALIQQNTLKAFEPKKDTSTRFIDKLRKRDHRYVNIAPKLEGRIVIEE